MAMWKAKRKQVGAGVLAVLAVTCLISSCSSGGGAGGATTPTSSASAGSSGSSISGSSAVAGPTSASASSSSASASASQSLTPTTINVALGDVPAPPPAALAAFKSATGITVNWLNISWPDLQTKIAAAATADTYFADVVDVDWSRVGTYAKLGWMVPLDGLLDVASMRSDMPQLASFTVGSETVGIPFDASFIVTTVNTDCFAKAGITTMPTTLDEYTSDLKTIQSKGVNAHPLGMGLAAVEGLSTNWYQTTANFGGGIFDKDLKPQFSDPKSGGYQALQWMVDAYKSGLIDSSMLNKKNGQIQQGEMAHGQVCSVFADYAGNVTTIYDNSSESTVVGKVRYIPTPGAGANVNVPDGMGIPKQAKSQQAAVKFIEWFSSPDSQADWSGINGAAKAISGYSLPSRLSTFKQLVTDKNLSGGDELAQMFATSARPVFDAGVPPWYPQFSTAVYTNVHAAVAGQMSVDAAVQAIVKTVDGLGS